jgi:succinate-acetate transporter protein
VAGRIRQIGKIHAPHRVSNPQPSGFKHSALTTTLVSMYIYLNINLKYLELSGTLNKATASELRTWAVRTV